MPNEGLDIAKAHRNQDGRADSLIGAIEWLAEVLEQENHALAAMDMPAAMRLVSDKQSALAALGQSAGGHSTPGVRVAAERLRSLAAENRTLLERALVVQNRIIGIVARAIPIAAPANRYGANGGFAVSGRPQAFALSARA